MAWLQVENGKITEGLGYMEHHIVPLPALRFPHFFGDRPGVAALSVQVLHDVFVALFVAVAFRPAGRRILEGIS